MAYLYSGIPCNNSKCKYLNKKFLLFGISVLLPELSRVPTRLSSINFIKIIQDFPGGPVVKNPPASVGT